jgi:RND family efflux transporter MFP subunit
MAKPGRIRSLLYYSAGVLLVVGAAAAGLSLWHQKDVELIGARAALADKAAQGPPVEVTSVAQGPKERLITLLGDTRPFQAATIYSKVGGYLKLIVVDRGDHVSEDQVVAVVDSAETDRQYDMAVADLENKRKNQERAQNLSVHGWLSAQQADQAAADFRMAQSRVAQLEVMKSYEELRAPFAGTVTARFVDAGALIQSSTANQSSNQPVMTIADLSRLRVDIYAEQQDATAIHVGDVADVVDGTNPERRTTAKIARTSEQLDPRTRTLFVELDVDNTNGFLAAGSFVYVTLHVPTTSYPEVPATALVTRGNGTYVAALGQDSLVHLKPVKIARADGAKVSLAEGAEVGEQVVLNLPDEVADGGRVHPSAAKR